MRVSFHVEVFSFFTAVPRSKSGRPPRAGVLAPQSDWLGRFSVILPHNSVAAVGSVFDAFANTAF